MNIQEKLIINYPLTAKIECNLNCYLLAKKRYLVFWDKIILKEDFQKILEELDYNTDKLISGWKTIIVVGSTNDEFEKSDLLYFNNVNTFVVFYLINEQKNKIFTNDTWIFAIGVSFRKYIRKINKIITNNKSTNGGT